MDEGTLLSKNLTIAPVYEEIRYTITWLDADGSFLNETTVSASAPPKLEKLPEDHDGFHYTHWSVEPDGERWNGWGRPLDANITLNAVRDADYIVRFCVENGPEIAQAGFKKGSVFSPARAPVPPVYTGLVFVAWQDAQGQDFSGRTVDSDSQLFAHYRPESAAELIERQTAPVRNRFPLPLLAGADVALAVLLVILLASGPKKARAPEKADAPAVVETAPEAAENGDASGQQPPDAQSPANA